MTKVERALILQPNGCIIDAEGKIVCRVVYASKALQRYIFDALCSAPEDVMHDDKLVKEGTRMESSYDP